MSCGKNKLVAKFILQFIQIAYFCFFCNFFVHFIICVYWRINFATNSVCPQLVGPTATHVNGWWKRSSIFLKQNARHRRSTVLYKSTFFRFTRPIRYLWRWSEEQGEKTALFFIIDCVLQWRCANALPVFTKQNELSCVACWAGSIENQEWFSNSVISTAYMRWSCTVCDILTLGQICEQEVVLLIRWYDCRIRIFKRLLLYNKINRKCTGRTICNLWQKRSSVFLSTCWHRYKH